MKPFRLTRILACPVLAGLVGSLLTPSLAAYPEPGRAVALIVPWAPGGSVDVFGRIFAPHLEKEIGARVEVVNKPGAGAQVGMTEVARAKPDGYTLGIASLPGLITIYLDRARKAVFKSESFAKIAMTGNDPEAVAVTAKSPFKSIKDLADAVRANPGKIKLAVGGLMGDSHLGGILLERSIGTKMAVVSFDGGLTPALTAMMGGHLDAYVGAPSSLAALAQSGDVRVIGIMDKVRSRLMPNVPTVMEQGFANTVMGASRGIVTPADIPPGVLVKLGEATKKAMAAEEVQKNLKSAWSVPAYLDSKGFADHWKQMEDQTRELLKVLATK